MKLHDGLPQAGRVGVGKLEITGACVGEIGAGVGETGDGIGSAGAGVGETGLGIDCLIGGDCVVGGDKVLGEDVGLEVGEAVGHERNGQTGRAGSR